MPWIAHLRFFSSSKSVLFLSAILFSSCLAQRAAGAEVVAGTSTASRSASPSSKSLDPETDWEIQRLAGFHEHQQDVETFDREREKGRIADDEAYEQWLIQRKRDLEDYRRQEKTKPVDPESTEDYHEELAKKKKIFLEHEKNESEFAQARKAQKGRSSSVVENSIDEFDLRKPRSRVDTKKRVLYGARPNYKVSRGNTASSGSGSYSGSNPSGNSGGLPGGGFDPNTLPPPPPPPDFGDFGGDPTFMPPPPMPEPFDGDIPPPPPLPPPMPGGDFNDGGADIFPPPPPPPDFGDF